MTESGELERAERTLCEAHGAYQMKIVDDAVYGPIRIQIVDEWIAAGSPLPKENWLYSRLVEARFKLGAAFEAGRGGWISVAERLPDSSTTVLFYVVGEDWIETGFYRDEEKVWQAERTLPQDETLSFAAEAVTHWMDMPAPPDSGDKEGIPNEL